MGWPITQLLVSVRNVDEAIVAFEGGADIIDVKEPNDGSLGCAAPGTIREIAQGLREVTFGLQRLSLALGELSEWENSSRLELCHAIQFATPGFLKLGLAGTHGSHETRSWTEEWRRVRTMIPGIHGWVAVAYADHLQADSPSIHSVLNAAIEAECQILLIDTHTKDGTSLGDRVSTGDLQLIRQTTRQHGLKLALAGQVKLADLPTLLPIGPDIVAVRGAVCDHGNRTATVDRLLVKQFRDALQELQFS